MCCCRGHRTIAKALGATCLSRTTALAAWRLWRGGGAALAKLGALAAGADIVRAELAEVGSQLVG